MKNIILKEDALLRVNAGGTAGNYLFTRPGNIFIFPGTFYFVIFLVEVYQYV